MDRDGEGGIDDGLPPVTPEQVKDMANTVDAHIRKKFEIVQGETIPYIEPPESMRGLTVEKVLLRDGVILHHHMQFTFWDSVRLLLGRKFFMHVVIHTENVVGRTHISETHFYVERFRLSNRRGDFATELRNEGENAGKDEDRGGRSVRRGD